MTIDGVFAESTAQTKSGPLELKAMPVLTSSATNAFISASRNSGEFGRVRASISSRSISARSMACPVEGHRIANAASTPASHHLRSIEISCKQFLGQKKGPGLFFE